MMHTSDFNYDLPEELIAQHPPENRGDSRMMVLNPADGSMVIRPFSCLPEYFQKGDLLALNNTRVIRARLYARKDTGARLEILLLTPSGSPGCWSCLMKNIRRSSLTALLWMSVTGPFIMFGTRCLNISMPLSSV